MNPYQNGFDATVLRVLYQELTGNAYIHPVIDQRTGIPIELWTMPSQYVEIIPGKSTLVDGYLYGASRENRKVFAADEVIHFKRPNPSDILYGMGKVEAAWGAAMMNAAMHEMDLSFFENKARPDYLMTIKTNASREEIERLEVQIDEKLRGKGRTGRFLTATADIDLKPMNFPPKDLGGREDIVEEIAAIFGVPVSMLKANDPNLASATVGFQSWKAISVLPLMRMDEETLNQNLVPLFGIEGDAFLAYDSPVVEDERFAFERRRSSVSAGVMTANEMRSREGLDVIDDPMADRLLINGQPLGGVAAMAAPMPFDAPRDEQIEPVSTPDELPAADAAAIVPPAAAALNGAQISSLLALATQAATAAIPIETARNIAAAAFPDIIPSVLDGIFAPIVPQAPPVVAKSLVLDDEYDLCNHTKDCGTGSGGFQEGNSCGGGAGGGGGGGGGGASLAKPAAHSTALPRDPRRMTADALSGALSGMGYSQVGQPRVENPNSRTERTQFYTVRDAGGNEKELPLHDLLTMVYASSSDPTTAKIKPPKRRASKSELVDELPVTEVLSPATKALTDIETRPPQTVADNARRALDIRAQKPESQRGMTAIGIARARDLANRVSLSEDTIRRMLAYFERHEVDKQGETWDEQGKGWQAWNGWGGDDGFVWARRKVEQFNREREQKAARKSCDCCAPSDNASTVSHKSLWEDRFSIAGIRTKATANDAAREFDDINDAEKEIADRVSKSLEQQVAAVIAKIRAAPAPTQALADDVEKVLRSAKYSRQIVNALRPYLANALESGVTLGLDTVTKLATGEPDFTPARDDLRAYAQSESVRLARGAADGIAKYTRVRVSKILGDGLAAGETIDQLADRVQEWAGEAGDEERSTRNRAVMIARTEAQRATRRAEVEAWKSTGMVEGKTWLLAPDPCEFCEAASNEFSTKSIGLEDSFFSKGDTMLGADGNEMALDYEDIDGPPLHPNCRCSLQPRLEPFLEDQAQQAEEDVDAYFDELTARAAKEKK